MANTQASKSNGAAKRMGNAALKNRRAASWARGQKRKEARRTEQVFQEKKNRINSDIGLLTPWQISKAARAAKRQAARGKVVQSHG
jgi:hypothetical protein